jgi:sugar lactone lactonase YvrE
VAIPDANASPWDVAISSDGTIYFTERATHRVRMIRDGQVTTVAGSGVKGYADGAALQAQFNYPAALAISPNGDAIYVADHDNNRIRMIRDGQVTTVTGSSMPGYADGAALQAQFYYPIALAISPNGGAIYVADYGNNRIRMICDGQVTTVAGSGVKGYADGAALQAHFYNPTGVAISPNGDAIYVADCGNKRIRMICVPNVSSLFIKIGDVSLGFHECLIAHWCPQLKQVLELTERSLTIEARAARADTLLRLYETREGADNIVLKGHNDNTSANNDVLHFNNVRLLQRPRFVHNMHLLKLIDTV